MEWNGWNGSRESCSIERLRDEWVDGLRWIKLMVQISSPAERAGKRQGVYGCGMGGSVCMGFFSCKNNEGRRASE